MPLTAPGVAVGSAEVPMQAERRRGVRAHQARHPGRSAEPAEPAPRQACSGPIVRDQFERIRQAAYSLPQVVKPGDYLAEHSAGFETHLAHGFSGCDFLVFSEEVQCMTPE